MKRTALFVLGVVAVSASALAQAPPTVPADPIGRPLAAAPANMREAATVIKWKPDFTYDTLRKARTVWCATTGPAFLSSSRSRSSAPASPTSTASRRI